MNLSHERVHRLPALSLTICCLFMLHARLYAQANVLTWHNDNARSGQNLSETALTPANVNSATFGRLFTLAVDGKVDAQPLYVSALSIPTKGLHNVVYVATEHDSVYAFDADTGAPLWQVSVLGLNEVPSDNRGCGQVTPEMGVTATPVIDLQVGPHGTMYLIAMSKAGSAYHHRIHALDLATGAEQFSGPIEIAATFPGNGVEGSGGTQTFAASQHKERPGLLILNGVVYTTWGSHCDAGPYTGWVIGYDESTLARTSILNLTPNGNDGGVWMAGAGPAADTNGNLYLMTGNGTFDTALTGGFPSLGDFGNAFVKIHVAANRSLSVTDYFTMFNTTSESNADQDLGSGGLMLLPPVLDANSQTRTLAVGAGKDQNIYVVDTNNMMGEFHTSTDQIYQQMNTAVGGGVFSSPAWFNGTMYYGAVGDVLRAFSFANGSFAMTPSSQSAHAFAFPGTTPSISANGTQNAIVWAAENSSPAVLHAYTAATLGTELYNSNQAANSRDHFGSGNKFIVPTIANGKVYVGTTNGVGVFGLLCSFSLLPTSTSIAVGGGTGQISNVASTGCNWNAASDSVWLTVTSGSSGTGSGSVGYSVAANTDPSSRAGTITVGGRPFVVTQAGTGCSYSINPTGITITASASAGFVNVTAGAGCGWTAVSNSPFLSITSGAAGTGNGSTGYSATANLTGATRIGTLTVAGQTFTLTQNAAGTANYAGKFANATTLITSSMLDSSGLAGIGTTLPAISLDVRTGALPQMGVAQTTDYLTFFASDVFGPAIYWNPGKDLRFGKGGASLYNPFGFIEQMRIQSATGNVGIGTQSPTSKLFVAGDINFTGTLRFQTSPAVQFPGGAGLQNAGLGIGALATNSTGANNTAAGYHALLNNTSGGNNTAMGAGALSANTTGSNNTAIGAGALANNTTGGNNVAIGVNSATNVAGGNSNNIQVGNAGLVGDSAFIRLGTAGTQTRFFAAGVRGVTTANNNAIPLMIDSNGQLGTVSSSRRFKQDIRNIGAMGITSADLLRLRPVIYRYRQPFADGSKPIQYGLIAEEVAQVAPDLVAHSASGEIETVKYQELAPLLLDGVQRQQVAIRRLQKEIDEHEQENQMIEERLHKLEAAIALLSRMLSRGASIVP